jgi:hypothetical protein
VTPHVDRRRLESFDGLTAVERSEVLAHARECPACREALVAREPSVLFALLAVHPLPEEALDGLSRRVRAEVAATATRPPARPWIRVASLAAALLLAAFLGIQIDRRQPVTRTARVEPAPAAPSAILETVAESSLPARGLELISSPGDADVVDFALGETQVVMIFDRELDI